MWCRHSVVVSGSNHFKGHVLQAHEEAIFSLCVVEQEGEEPTLVSGAKDGKLAMWKITTTEEEAHLDSVKELEVLLVSDFCFVEKEIKQDNKT